MLTLNIKSGIAVWIFILMSIPFIAHAQTEPILSIYGEVKTPLNLSLNDLMKQPQIVHKTKSQNGKENIFQGVLLIELLKQAGVTTGANLRGENLVKYVLITAADGYEVLYSLPEIDPEFTDQQIILAITQNGQPLPANEGPLRIIAPNDKRPARWIKEVRGIKIGYIKD